MSTPPSTPPSTTPTTLEPRIPGLDAGTVEITADDIRDALHSLDYVSGRAERLAAADGVTAHVEAARASLDAALALLEAFRQSFTMTTLADLATLPPRIAARVIPVDTLAALDAIKRGTWAIVAPTRRDELVRAGLAYWNDGGAVHAYQLTDTGDLLRRAALAQRREREAAADREARA